MSLEKKIKELEDELKLYKESPYFNSYIGLYTTIERWSKEMKDKTFSIASGTDEDMKTFEKAHKFSLSFKSLYEQLDFLRSKITPFQEAEAKKEANNILERALQEDGTIDGNN